MTCEATRLMNLAKRGDRGAFDRLVEGLQGRTLAIAQGLVGSREDALELSQEAFLKTYRARASFRDGESFVPWFNRILRNTCFSFLRRRGKLGLHSLDAPSGDTARGDSRGLDIADERGSAASHFSTKERARVFWETLDTLSPKDRRILQLRHFDELSYQEIAERLEIPIGTVMSRLFHARRRLRERLEGQLEETPDSIPSTVLMS
jgi:RNA polymerase sigma-70 factor (ECF subfamily)